MASTTLVSLTIEDQYYFIAINIDYWQRIRLGVEGWRTDTLSRGGVLGHSQGDRAHDKAWIIKDMMF